MAQGWASTTRCKCGRDEKVKEGEHAEEKKKESHETSARILSY